MSTKKIIFICLGIILAAAAVIALIFMTEPSAKSVSATKKTDILVEVVEVSKGDYQPAFDATGEVQPVQEVMLSPLVSGKIINRSPAFAPGGYVEEGEMLLQIEPADYKNQLALRKSELLQAKTELAIEMGRQKVAEMDLALAGIDSLSSEERALVLRQPQLNAIKANIQASRASVEQAKLNLARTTIRAPFDAHIIEQNVTKGSQVSPGDNLGMLAGTEFYWVELALSGEKLPWLRFPNSNKTKGSEVKIRENNWPKGDYRTGYLANQIGALNQQTRLARVLVKVPDPFGIKNPEKNKRKLMIGSFVEAEIQAMPVQNVVRLDRDYLRRNQTVWVMENGKLSIRPVEILLTDTEYAYIKSGLKDGEEVVTTNLSTVTEGIGLRIKKTDSLKTNKQETNDHAE